jgi:methyl-accepting chemotaxis protein
MNRMKSLKWNILSAFGIIIVILLIMSVVSTSMIFNYNQKVETMVQKESKLLVDDVKLSGNIQERIALIRGYVLFEDEEYLTRFEAVTEESKVIQDDILKASNSEEAKKLVEKSIEWRTFIQDELVPQVKSGNDAFAQSVL